MAKQILVVDIETTSLDANIAEIRVFGAYDPMQNKYFIYKWGDRALARATELFKEYPLILTFNGNKYDIPILERHGVPAPVRHIDIYEIFKHKRAALLGTFESYSLKGLIMQLGLDGVGKGEIDYSIFKKTDWTHNEQDLILKYLKQDLILEWKLWQYLTKRFAILAKFLPKKDAEQYKHITTSLATYTYKIICHGAGIQELYDERPRWSLIPGTYKTPPSKLSADGQVILLRFTYLYPQTILQFNLLSYDCNCCPMKEGKFHGRNYYVVKGFYCQKQHGKVEKFLKNLYLNAQRDPELKIVFYIVYNNLHKVITNGGYYSTYDAIAANDCIALGKQQIKIVVNRFIEAGYKVLYVEDDNIFIALDEQHTLENLIKIKDEIIKFLKSKMPFPSETFDMIIQDRIQYIQFFKKTAHSRNFLITGQYVYITDDGRTISKNTPLEEVQKIMGGFHEE